MASAATLLRERVQSVLSSRCEAAFLLTNKELEDVFASFAGEIPRGAFTEIAGTASSGRTTLLYSLLAAASADQEFCVLLDAEDAFDPASAAAAGVNLSRILWVRCGGNVEHALKAADLLTQAGGFGLVAIDLGNVSAKIVRRIPLTSWFRLRRAVEHTRTGLVVIAQQLHAQSCSTVKIELSRSRTLWSGDLPGSLLQGFETNAQYRRNHRAQQRPVTIRR